MKKETLKKIFQNIIRIINISLALLIIIIGLISIFNKELILKIIDQIGVLIQGLGYRNYFILFLSSLIESFPVIGIIIPGQNIMLLVAMFFAQKNTNNLIFVCTIASLGAIIGNYIGYRLGKKYGDGFFKKYGNYFGVGVTEVKYLKKGICTWGPIGIILGKFHNVARAFVPFIAGSMDMKKPVFMFYNIIGSIIRATTMIILGTLFGKYYEWIVNNFRIIMLVLIAGIAIYIYFFKKEEFKKYLKEKNEELDELVSKK